jgi:MFS family permease
LGAVGVGAIGGALLLPHIRRASSVEALALGATLLMGLATLGLSFASTLPIGMALSVVAGAAWLTMLTTLNGTAQAVLPNWVRGRGLAIYLTAFFGSMTIGSLAWGQIAAWTSLDAALILAGVLGTVAAFGARLLLLPPTDDADLSPSNHWPSPSIADGVEPAGGPIMVTITYEIDLSDQAAFAEAARHLGAIRRRDGAYDWGLMKDAAVPRSVTEWFLVGSWEEHLRQHVRFVVADEVVQEAVRAFHRGATSPEVRHLIPIGTQPSALALAQIAGDASGHQHHDI